MSTTHTDASPAITLTDTAATKVAELLEQEGNPELALRVAVRPAPGDAERPGRRPPLPGWSGQYARHSSLPWPAPSAWRVGASVA